MIGLPLKSNILTFDLICCFGSTSLSSLDLTFVLENIASEKFDTSQMTRVSLDGPFYLIVFLY